MKPEQKVKTVGELLAWKTNHMLTANPEYQRGAVWDVSQKKKLVDSVFRGYPIPLIYLHHISRDIGGARRDDFEVIDGQQRINALHGFHEGAFKLFDPATDASQAKFPSFIVTTPCEWGGKSFDELPDHLRRQFVDTELSVVFISTDEPNEARDLFIRLQAGMPLNSQEKRDAWPGGFTEFILKLAGKPEITRYPGHAFFTLIMKSDAKRRGEIRQLSAQVAMLFLS